MKNKQLDTKDLLMNKKEELIWRVIDNVIMTLSIEVVILMTTKNVITKEKNMGIVSVVVMDVINMKSAP